VVFLGFPLKFGINIRGKVAIFAGGIMGFVNTIIYVY